MELKLKANLRDMNLDFDNITSTAMFESIQSHKIILVLIFVIDRLLPILPISFLYLCQSFPSLTK